MSIKFKHFLFFGLGGPIVNMLVWFGLRHHDDGQDTLAGDTEETNYWDNKPKSSLCFYVEERNVDYVLHVCISLLFLN